MDEPITPSGAVASTASSHALFSVWDGSSLIECAAAISPSNGQDIELWGVGAAGSTLGRSWRACPAPIMAFPGVIVSGAS